MAGTSLRFQTVWSLASQHHLLGFQSKAFTNRTSIDVHSDMTSTFRLHTSSTKNLTWQADNCAVLFSDRGFHSDVCNDKCKTVFLSLWTYNDPPKVRLHIQVATSQVSTELSFKFQWLLDVQVIIQQVYVLPTQCIYVFCVDLRTNSDYFPIQH